MNSLVDAQNIFIVLLLGSFFLVPPAAPAQLPQLLVFFRFLFLFLLLFVLDPKLFLLHLLHVFFFFLLDLFPTALIILQT